VATMNPLLSNPKALAELGEKIYNEKYRAKFEADHDGKFAAIDVQSTEAFIGNTPEEAVTLARSARKDVLVHLIKIGSAGAFRVSYTSHANANWLY
jgi:hypothetical protein